MHKIDSGLAIKPACPIPGKPWIGGGSIAKPKDFGDKLEISKQPEIDGKTHYSNKINGVEPEKGFGGKLIEGAKGFGDKVAGCVKGWGGGGWIKKEELDCIKGDPRTIHKPQMPKDLDELIKQLEQQPDPRM